MSDARPHRERALLRARRLETLIDTERPDRDTDLDVARGRQQLWSRHQPESVPLRSGLFFSTSGQRSLFQELDAPRGITQQLLLTLIFEAQCRRGPASTISMFRRPLQWSDDPDLLPWIKLVAVPTIDRVATRTTARRPAERRVVQIRSALDRLDRAGRVELDGGNGQRGRFNRVRLLHEGVRQRDATKIGYSTPRAAEDVVAVPADFWLQGWVHALESSEIVVLMTLLRAWALLTDEMKEEGLLMPRSAWDVTFGERGRGHEAYRMLSRFGLVGIVRDDGRRDDGTVRDLHTDEAATTATDPHRFFVHAEALSERAVPTVVRALHLQVGGMRLDDAYMLSVYPESPTSEDFFTSLRHPKSG